MYHPLEARSPLIDSALWDYVARVPAGRAGALELQIMTGFFQ
jgi:hypothetical protein